MPLWNIKMLCDRIDVSEGIDVNKTSESKSVCDICHYLYFLNYSSKFQPNVCNRWHDLLMMSMNLSNMAILNIKGSDYCFIISLISKSEAINLTQNADLTEKSGILWNKNLFSYIKIGKEILTFGNTGIEENKFGGHVTPIFWEGVDIEKLLLSNKICFGEKKYKYFMGYLYNGNKVKPLNIMLPKTSTFVKSYDGHLDGCIFWLKMMAY